MHRSLALLALLSASALGAQEPVVPAETTGPAVTIDAGMTRADVVARLGAPAAERTAGAYVYLFFANGCVRSCGMDDLVILRDGKVSDAIFRGAGRRYSGTSSSPEGVTPAATLGPRAGRARGDALAFDAPAPSMIAPPPARADAPAAPAVPPARPALAAAEPVADPATRPAQPPSAAATSAAPAAAPATAAPTRRAPVDAFRIVPVLPDTARAATDSTSRP